MPTETLRIIEQKLSKQRIKSLPFLKRATKGFKKYLREDGTHNHLSEDYCAVKEAIEEVQDTLNQCCFDVRRGYTNNWRMKIVFHLQCWSYKLLCKEWNKRHIL